MDNLKSKRELDMLLAEGKPVLALFCASWCPFCQSFFESFDDVTAKFSAGTVVRVYLDDYDNPLWEEYFIEAVPTVIFFERGLVSGRLDGGLGSGLNKKMFESWLTKYGAKLT